MQKIAQEQSRRNAARRRRDVAARHNQAGRWSPRPIPMLTAGPVHYEVGGNVEATCFGGIAAVHRLVTRLGLPEAIDADLAPAPRHRPLPEPGEPRPDRAAGGPIGHAINRLSARSTRPSRQTTPI